MLDAYFQCIDILHPVFCTYVIYGNKHIFIVIVIVMDNTNRQALCIIWMYWMY